MFDIGWTELVIIGVVALIAIGPKELPGVLRALGHWMGKIRRMASEFQDQFREAMREAEVADLKKQVDDMTATAQGYSNFDPLADVQKSFDNFTADKPAETPPPAPTAEATAPATEPSASPQADAAVTTAAPPPASSDKPGGAA